MSLTPEIIVLLSLDAIFLFFGVMALFLSSRIVLLWREHARSALQYRLIAQTSLVATIIKYIFVLKLPLFLFFIYTCDKLSSIIAGAMCASGVVNSVDFGLYLSVFKLLNLYLFGFWLLLHDADTKSEKQPYTRLKFALFLLFALPLLAEIGLEIGFFASLDISKIVSCCGTLFSAASSSYLSVLFVVDEGVWVGLFYAFFALLLLAGRLSFLPVMVFANGLFLLFALISLIVFFSPYIYELPTHRCPFCLLQKEYGYVGYWLYTVLFMGTFYGISGGVLAWLTQSNPQRFFKRSMVFNTLYVVSVSAYPLFYYLKNGVWL